MERYPLTVLVCFVLIVLNAWVGLRLKRVEREKLYRRLVGLVCLAGWVVMAVWYLWPSRFNAWDSWPLHICDIAALAGPMAMLTRWRAATTLVYFWGFGLTTQGFFTPVLEAGPDQITYWLFWSNHTIVVGLAVYRVVVNGYRPKLGDLFVVIGLTMLWMAVVLPINVIFDLNYGYLGRFPPNPDVRTLVDLLGPWPGRLLWMSLLVIFVCVVLWLPWALARRRGGEAADPGGA